MNTEALFLFLILLLGLVLCSFLGGNCVNEGFSMKKTIKNTVNDDDESIKKYNPNKKSNNSNNSNKGYDNYNHFSGSASQLTNGSTFTEPNGGTVVVNTSSDGTQTLQVTPSGGGSPMTFTTKEPMTTYSGSNGTAVKFYGPNGQSATIINGDDGQEAIKITDSNHNSVIYTSSGTAAISSNNNNNNYTSYFGSTGDVIPQNNSAYTGSAGAVTGPGGNTAAYATGPRGNTVAGTTVNNYNPPGTAGPYNPPGSTANNYNPPGTAGPYNPPGSTANNYNPPGTAGPYNPPGSSEYNPYSDSLPQGIPRSQIIPGQEDLYILKSEVVPPVCPVCPVASNAYSENKKCPPCEPCGRCPEPSMTCKAVPNYNATTSQYLPIPVLNSFSTFGM